MDEAKLAEIESLLGQIDGIVSQVRDLLGGGDMGTPAADIDAIMPEGAPPGGGTPLGDFFKG